MKRVVASVMLVILVLSCVSKQRQAPFERSERISPIVVSEKVGETITCDERDRFELFPAVQGFREARFYSIRHIGYELEILTETEILVSVNHDRDAVVTLRDYIDNYDEITRDRARWESKWGVVDYDTLCVPITMREVTIVKQEHQRRAVRGGVTCCLITSVSGAALGVVLAASIQNASNEESYYPLYAIGAGVLVGLIGGITKSLSKLGDGDAIFVIKESRKPRVVEKR